MRMFSGRLLKRCERSLKQVFFFSQRWNGSYNVIACPGQGSQYVGMLSHHHKNDIIDSIIETTNRTMPYNLFKLCKEGPKDILDRTIYCQPAVTMATVIGFEQLKSMYSNENGSELKVDAVCGFSVGEIPALYVARRIDFKQCKKETSFFFRTVGDWACAMDFASSFIPSGMISMQGRTFEEAKEICEDLTLFKNDRNNHCISVAIEQYPRSVSLGGSHIMLNKIMNREHSLLQDTKNVKLTKLSTSGAFHTRYMLPAQEMFYETVRHHEIENNSVDVYSNVTGKPYSIKDNIGELLVRQLTEPVLWCDIISRINNLHEKSPLGIYEIGTGKQLCTMFSKINRKLLKVITNIEM